MALLRAAPPSRRIRRRLTPPPRLIVKCQNVTSQAKHGRSLVCAARSIPPLFMARSRIIDNAPTVCRPAFYAKIDRVCRLFNIAQSRE